MARTFTTRAAGGATIGAGEVNQLISSRELSGCHDWALVMTATLRFFGYPALMVDTAGLQWAEDYASGNTQAFSGHVFAEVLTNEGWMLVDCTAGRYTLDYEPANPVIPPSGAGDAKGYYALYKGIDPASYGVTSNQVLQERMSLFAGVLATLELEPPDYDWQSFQ
jgi:transglutaminase-like putative cysteine protease